MTVQEARQLAERAHGDQRDRDGSLHIDHVARVADRAGASEAFQRVAWLHDVMEDTNVDPTELRARLPEPEWMALRLLTHDETEPYAGYIDRIADAEGLAGTLARSVKEADILDNVGRCCAAHDPAIGQYGSALARLWRDLR